VHHIRRKRPLLINPLFTIYRPSITACTLYNKGRFHFAVHSWRGVHWNIYIYNFICSGKGILLWSMTVWIRMSHLGYSWRSFIVLHFYYCIYRCGMTPKHINFFCYELSTFDVGKKNNRGVGAERLWFGISILGQELD
jgi:hypothetical protein